MKCIKLIAAAVLMLCMTAVHAWAEENVYPIYSTDILTTLDGIPIQGYNIGGRTLIILDDLDDYGFTVSYDDSIRTLIVNKTHKLAADFKPDIKRGTGGRVIGYTKNTDLKAYVNGNFADTMVVDGKLAAVVEELSSRAMYSGIITQSAYNMDFDYSDDERILRLTTDPADEPSYEDKLNELSAYVKEHPTYSVRCEKISEECDALLIDEDNLGKTITRFYLLYRSGLCIDMTGILDSAYGFASFPSMTVFDGRLSEDKTKFLFDGEQYKATGMRSSELIDSGRYEMSVPNGIVSKIE